jgi:hypothetical protein
MRYTERGWTNNGSQEEGQEESSQEESHQKEVVFILESLEWDRRGHEGPRRILPCSRPAQAGLQDVALLRRASGSAGTPLVVIISSFSDRLHNSLQFITTP